MIVREQQIFEKASCYCIDGLACHNTDSSKLVSFWKQCWTPRQSWDGHSGGRRKGTEGKTKSIGSGMVLPGRLYRFDKVNLSVMI